LVNEEGAFIDGYSLSGVTIRDLKIGEERIIKVRLGVKADALHVGGINIFGRAYGNYPQDLALHIEYAPGIPQTSLTDLSNAREAIGTHREETRAKGGDQTWESIAKVASG
jgi:hypothetical protein